MSDDNTNTETEDTTSKLGATITYDSQHALNAAKAYKNQIANQLKTKLKGRPYSAAKQRRNDVGVRLTENALGLSSLPQNFASSYPSGTSSTGGTTTDSFLKNSGSNYAGWHRANPVNMSSALSDDDFLEGAYQSLLGRASDAHGKAHWQNALDRNISRDQVIADMKRTYNPHSNSVEYRDKFIGEAYKNLLGRDVGVEGIDYWSKAMEGGQSEDSIIADIKRGEEYGRYQQNQMRDAINSKTDSQLMRENYRDQIASLGTDWQQANDEVQGEYGTGPDYSSLFATDDGIYQQDPDASSFSSLSYLANVDDPDPGIWAKALGKAGKDALAGVNISTLVDSFINSYIT